MIRSDPEFAPIRYERTAKLEASHGALVVAKCQVDTGAGIRTVREVLAGGDATTSGIRRRVAAWACERGYLRPIKSEPKPEVAPSLDELLARADARLAGKP